MDTLLSDPGSKDVKGEIMPQLQLIEHRWLEKYLIEQCDSLLSPISVQSHPSMIAPPLLVQCRQTHSFATEAHLASGKDLTLNPSDRLPLPPRVTKHKISARLNVNENRQRSREENCMTPQAAICR